MHQADAFGGRASENEGAGACARRGRQHLVVSGRARTCARPERACAACSTAVMVRWGARLRPCPNDVLAGAGTTKSRSAATSPRYRGFDAKHAEAGGAARPCRRHQRRCRSESNMWLPRRMLVQAARSASPSLVGARIVPPAQALGVAHRVSRPRLARLRFLFHVRLGYGCRGPDHPSQAPVA